MLSRVDEWIVETFTAEYVTLFTESDDIDIATDAMVDRVFDAVREAASRIGWSYVEGEADDVWHDIGPGNDCDVVGIPPPAEPMSWG